jgi:hypothetical protein
MAAIKNGTKKNWLEAKLADASRRILHAMAADPAEAKVEWAEAADAEVDVAGLLEVEGRNLEAAIHRFSAASSFAKAERYADAITLARSALSFSLKEAHRREIETYLKKWLSKARKQWDQRRRKHPKSVA